MIANPSPSPGDLERRHRAEQRLREHHAPTAADLTTAETENLLHELQVHQIELEMQNEELQQARATVEAGLEKYSDLYDFAPVGYLTLDREGTIQEINRTAATMLGLDRSQLLKRCLCFSLSPADLPPFNAFLRKVFESKKRESCEVTLTGMPPVEVRIEAALAGGGESAVPSWRTSPTISEPKRTATS